MADDTDVLIKFCEDEWAQARQSETQRAMMTNFIIVLFGVVFGFIIEIGFVKKILPLAGLLIFIGIYGALVSAKFYERWQYARRRVRYWRKRIDELHPDAKLLELMGEAENEHTKANPSLRKIRLHWFWCTLHIVIALIGFVCAIVIIAH